MNAILSGAELSVKVAFSLIGIMAFWLGMMKIAEKCGLIEFIAKVIKPITKVLFNEIPEVFDKEGFALLLSCLHKIYLKILKSDFNLMINPNEEYEINIYIKLFEEHLKNYSQIKDLPKILEEEKLKNNDENVIQEVDETKENEESNQNN